METLIAYPDAEDKLEALKDFMKNHSIFYKREESMSTESISVQITNAVKEVKLHQEGKISLQDARDLL